MQCVVTYNIDKHKPVITITGEGEADEMMLDMLACCSEFTVVVELPEKDELIINHAS
jgi:hypothetical protein